MLIAFIDTKLWDKLISLEIRQKRVNVTGKKTPSDESLNPKLILCNESVSFSSNQFDSFFLDYFFIHLSLFSVSKIHETHYLLYLIFVFVINGLNVFRFWTFICWYFDKVWLWEFYWVKYCLLIKPIILTMISRLLIQSSYFY